MRRKLLPSGRTRKLLTALIVASLTSLAASTPAAAHRYGPHSTNPNDAAEVKLFIENEVRVSIKDVQTDGHCVTLVRRSNRSVAARSCGTVAVVTDALPSQFHVCIEGHSTCRTIIVD